MKVKCRPLIQRAVHCNGAAVQLDQIFDDRESKTVPARLVRPDGARAENGSNGRAWVGASGNALTVVADDDPSHLLVRTELYRYVSPSGVYSDSIIQEICQNLAESIRWPRPARWVGTTDFNLEMLGDGEGKELLDDIAATV